MMNYKTLLGMLAAIAIVSCSPSGHETDMHDVHDETKFQYTVYSNNFELFSEADAFVVGETANVLSHFSILPDFKAIETGKISIVLIVNGKEIRQTLEGPSRKGIYSFDIMPNTQGKGLLKFEITNENGYFEVIVPEVIVFTNKEEAHEATANTEVSNTNTTVFTKEQSWKIDFSTDCPKTQPFGQVIKTAALVQSVQGSEIVVTAKTNGIVLFSDNYLLEGMEVSVGQALFNISGSDLSDNNMSVKFSEAKSNFERANAEYVRAMELANDKIVSEKELQISKNHFDNAKAVYDNLTKNFNASGQIAKSPFKGYIKQVIVKNGAYVEVGQGVLIVSQNKTLVLTADLPQKYVTVLNSIKSANVRSINDNKTYTFEQLNGRILSYGKATNSDNYLIPINLQVENNGSFVAGSFVEVFLKSFSNSLALVIPTTALIEEQGNFFVWVQVTPELFEKREVFIGGSDGINTEIKNGITANERIVTRGAMLIKLAQATGSLDAHSGHVH